MNTFTLVQRALDATLDDESKNGLDVTTIETGRIVAAVQTVVDALTPPDGGRYIVAFADIQTAQTMLGDRRIIVSSKPLRDRSLTMVEKAVVIATFAAHEIGHTLVTRPRMGRVKEHNHHSGFHAVANLGDDIILEPVMVDRFPILADAFAFTGLWVLRATSEALPRTYGLTRGMTTPERFNILLGATRYADIPEIIWADGATIAERDWSRAWADRLVACPLDDHDGFLALCDEAWLRIRSEAEVEDEPVITEPTPGGDQPQPTDEEGEDEGEGGQGEDDESSDDDEPGESDEDGEGESDEPGENESEDDESEDGESEGEGESDEDEGDEATEGGDEATTEGEGTPDPNDQPTDWDDDEDDDEAEGDESDGTDGSGESDEDMGDESDAEGDESEGADEVDSEDDPGEDADGGGGNPDVDQAPRSEDDFDKSKVEESTHNQAERDPYDWAGRDVDEKVRSYTSTTVTAFGKHGSLSTTWS